MGAFCGLEATRPLGVPYQGHRFLADALEIRDAWVKERDQLGARGNTARNGRAGAIRIERREVVLFFD